MMKLEFIDRRDVELTQAWLKDLENLGYQFPKVEKDKLWSRTEAIRSASSIALASPSESFQREMGWMKYRCTLSTSKPNFKKTLLVVVFNNAFYQIISTYEEIYKQFFPNIIFYGPIKGKPDSRVNLIDLDGETQHAGGLGFRALMKAYEQHPGYENYLYTGDVCTALLLIISY